MGQSFNKAVWCAVAIFGMFGCERTRIPDSGLSGEQLDVSAPRFLRSGTLEWVVAMPEGTSSQPYALISNAGQTHLFEVTTKKGSQVVKVLPLGAVSAEWVRAASQHSGSEVRFVSAKTLMSEAPVLSSSVGMTTFKAGQPGEVTWLGGAPRVPTSVMYVTQASGDLTQRMLASGVWDEREGGLKIADGLDLQGEVLVLPDGALIPELDDYIVGVIGGKPSEVPGFTFRPVELDPALLKKEERRIRQAAMELGVDALSWKDDRGVHVMGLDLYDERVTQGQGVVPGPLGVVMTFDDQKGVFRGVQALDGLRRGHAMKAVHALDGVKVSVAGSQLAGALRVDEMLGGAHRAQWMYHSMITDREALEGPEYIYLARAALLSDAPYDALVFAGRAREAFWQWNGVGNSLGMGRAFKLSGLAHQQSDDHMRALEHFEKSVKSYKKAGDELAAAEVEMLASDVARRHGMRDRALLEGKRSRSRYYHGNDVYACGQAELDLVDVYLEYDMKDEAKSTARYGFLRMQELGSAVGLNRAQIMEALSTHRSQPGSVTVQELRGYHDRARELRDGWGEMAAASTLVLLGADLESDELQSVGSALVRGRAQFGAQMLGGRIDRALASACAQGFTSKTDPSVAALCQKVMQGHAPGDGLVKGWLAQGYGNILRGLDEEAAESSTRLQALITEELTTKNPTLAGQIQLYLSAAATDDATREARLEEGLVNLRRVDVSQRALTMYALAMELEQRGQLQFKLPLLQDAAESAHAQGQRQLAIKAGMAHTEALREAGLLEEALRALQLTQGRLTDEDGQFKAQIAFERALIGAMRGTASTAKADWGVAYDSVDKLGTIEALEVLLHALDVSLSQAKGVRAADMQSRIESLETAMTPALIASLEGKRVLAHAELLRAEQFEAEGDLNRALNLASSSSSTLADDPAPEAVWVRARALSMLARHAYSTAQTEETEQRLEELWARQVEGLREGRFSAEDYRAPVSVARALADMRYLRGDADAARAIFSELMLAGLSPTTDMASVACERGRLLIVSGELKKGRAELDRCVALKPEGEVAYRAKMMRALLEDEPGKRRAAMIRMLDSRSARERVRREMLLDINQLKALDRKQGSMETSQYKRYTSAKTGEAQAKEGSALIDLWLTNGKVEQAQGVLEELKPLFYELGEEYPVDYVRLKADIMLHELAVLDALFYLERASVELPQGLEPARQIALDTLRARLALSLGQWTRARVLLSEASALAKESGEKDLLSQINSLAMSFELQL